VSTLVLSLLLALPAWPDSLVTLELEFDPDQWEYACENPSEDIPVPAVLTAGGTEMEATFRIRGQSSRYYPKKSIKVRILNGRRLWGFDELNLNAQYLDYTRIRENLSYIFHRRAGCIVPEVHMTELLFNGETQGAYLFVEDVDGDFLERTPFSDNSVVYKCWLDGSCLDRPWEMDLYTKKTHEDEPFDDLELLAGWLPYAPDSVFRDDLAGRVALEELLDFVAANVLVAHGSCYYHNYHLILDRPGGTGTWHPVTWDMDRTWSISYGPNTPYFMSANAYNRPNPLVWRSWVDDDIRALLVDRVRELEPLLLDMEAGGTVDSLAALTEPLVEEDPFRDYTMWQFENQVQIVRDWPEDRIGCLEDQFQHWPLPFRTYPAEREDGVCRLRWSSAGPGCSYLVEVSADSSFEDPSQIVSTWSLTDTSLTASEAQAPSGAFWRVTADNGRASVGCLNRVRALDPVWHPPTLTGSLVINEINYRSPPDAPAGDWLELANPGPDTVWTGGWSVRNGAADHLHVLDNCALPPGKALVVYEDSAAFFSRHPGCPTDGAGMDFGLAAEGERLRIFTPLGEMADFVRYRSESPWPEAPDGLGPTLSLLDPSLDNALAESWEAGPFAGTPGVRNDSLPGWASRPPLALGPVRPNPVVSGAELTVSSRQGGPARLSVYDLAGRLRIRSGRMELPRGGSTLDVDAAGLEPGVYYVVVAHRGMTASAGMVVLAK
jgi:hypothetical protein